MTGYFIHKFVSGIGAGIGFGLIIYPFIFLTKLESYEVFSSFEELVVFYGITGVILLFVGFKALKFFKKQELKEKKSEA